MADRTPSARIIVEPHPLLDVGLVWVGWPGAIGGPAAAISSPPWLDADCAPAAIPAADPGEVAAVRALLRHGGFKPAGRSKPCSEYIRAAIADGRFPRIDPVVDLTNAAVLHGGLPISTIDVDRAVGPLRIGIAPVGSSYVFNSGGQVIDTGGLLCLFDADGACANAVKDAQRTKTTADTTATLTVIWGTTAIPGRTAAVAAWFGERAARLGGAAARLVVTG